MLNIKSHLLILLLSSFVIAQSPPQKPTDKPRDQAIKLKLHDGSKYCYTPYFTKGESYVYLDNCGSAIPARYDVFQRISWRVNNIWLCLTAPSSVTGLLGPSTQSWDYLILRPCALNDANQRWIIKNNAFYTSDSRFRIKDYGYYAFISKNKNDYYDHTIDSSMTNWINTIATPGTITIRTFIGWVFVSPIKFSIYYLENNFSSPDEMKYLYYNPENGHISQYHPKNGSMACLTAYHSRSHDWDWAGWEDCNDNIPKSKDGKYWDFFALNDNEGTLRDRDGNFLRVTQYGANWGVPYTIKPSYLDKDTSNSPKSIFLFDPYIDKWNRYVNANLEYSLHFCPAPGSSKGANNTSNNKRILRSLPPNFRITDEWIRRFWTIATTTLRGSESHIAYCGICLLQSYQMIAELQEYHYRSPLQSGGYFFDTRPNTDPFVSFRRRFPIIAARLENTINYARLPYRVNENIQTRSARAYYAMALTMLPDYGITPSRYLNNIDEIRNLLGEMLRSPIGTMWITHFVRTLPTGEVIPHGQPVLRTQEGLMFIPTNVVGNPSLEAYRQYLHNQVANTIDGIINILAPAGQTLTEFMSLRISNTYENDVNVYISNHSCVGEGDGRRGNLQFPLSATINKCLGGRCSIQ